MMKNKRLIVILAIVGIVLLILIPAPETPEVILVIESETEWPIMDTAVLNHHETLELMDQRPERYKGEKGMELMMIEMGEEE